MTFAARRSRQSIEIAARDRRDAVETGKTGKTTKCQAIVTPMVNKSAGPDLCATQTPFEMMKEVEQKAGTGSN